MNSPRLLKLFAHASTAIMLLICSCSPAPQKVNSIPGPDIVIEVKRDGRVIIDSQPYSVDDAEIYLRSKKGSKGKARVLTNDDNFPPHANESRIIDAIADARLDLVHSVYRTVH